MVILAPPAGEGFLQWIISGRVRLIVGGKLLKELDRRENFQEWWRQAQLAGLVVRVDDEAVQQETNRLVEENACDSDDPHVIALAIVGGARLLYTNDQELTRDFKNRQLIDHPRGRIYSTRMDSTFSRQKRRLLATSSCRLN